MHNKNNKSGDYMNKKDRITGGLMGVVVGDALGLPTQFMSRAEVRRNPVTGMTGYGTFNLPPGSWSDDSSLTLCLAESLTKNLTQGYDIMERFVMWLQDGYMTPYGYAYDVGGTTMVAIRNMIKTGHPMAGGLKEEDNGNGALMRILPAAIYFACDSQMPQEVGRIAGMTHGHIRSQLACRFYSVMATFLLDGMGAYSAYANTAVALRSYLEKIPKEKVHFERILFSRIEKLPEEEIKSGGYVIHTLEAALWCLLRHDNYAETVLEAVNLGEDTDTTAAVAGSLAGILYGQQGIPQEWIDILVRKELVEAVIQGFVETCKWH